MYEREYEYVSAIAKEGSLSGAAAMLKCTQPALTHFLKKEEEQIGMPLFQRINNRMVLTYAGECYMENVEKILSIQTRMRATIADMAKQDLGRIRVGIPAIRRPFTIFAVIPAFKKKYPGIDISLTELPSKALEDRLENLELDCVAVNVSKKRDCFDYIPLRKERYVLAVHKDDPLLSKAAARPDLPYPVLDPALLNGTEMIMLGREHRIRQYADAVLESVRAEPVIAMHSRSLDGAMEAVASGLGCTFTPELLLTYVKGAENVRFLCVEHPDAEYEFDLLLRHGAYVSPSLSEFVALFKRAYLSMTEKDR